jgi:hypothetical protein
LATSPLRLTTSIFFPQQNTCDHIPYVSKEYYTFVEATFMQNLKN